MNIPGKHEAKNIRSPPIVHRFSPAARRRPIPCLRSLSSAQHPPSSTSFRAEKTGGCSSHHIIITAGCNWKQGSFLLGCMVTRVSVCSDTSRASNSPSHLPSTERRQKSLTARWTSKAQCSHAPLRCKRSSV